MAKIRGGVRDFLRRPDCPRIAQIMAKHPELCCIFAAFLLTLAGRYSESQSTSNTPGHIMYLPRPFFSRSSSVTDLFFGELDVLDYLVEEEGVVMVMYYAPWCSSSLHRRQEFEKAANISGDQVKFVAINCWWSDGKCRKKFTFDRFGRLFVYHKHLNPFEYTGLPSVEHLVTFLDHFIRPLTFIHSVEELVLFLPSSDNVVLGFFDFHSSPQPPGYLQFYYAALRQLCQAPHQPVKFGVVPSRHLADRIGMNVLGQESAILVRATNDSVTFPRASNFTSSNIQLWIKKYKQVPVVQWIVPKRVKSLQLSLHLRKGPALIFFTPSWIYPNDKLALLREEALVYSSCYKSPKIEELVMGSRLLRQQLGRINAAMATVCSNLKQAPPTINSQHQRYFKRKCCHCVNSTYLGFSQLNYCDICQHIPVSLHRGHLCTDNHDMSYLSPHMMNLLKKNFFGCEAVTSNYYANHHTSICCHSDHSSKSFNHYTIEGNTAPRRPSRDPYILANNKLRVLQRRCQRFTLSGSEKYSVPRHLKHNDEAMWGLGCNNRTVHFYAMDSRHHAIFGKRLGMNSSAEAVLVDIDNDVHHVMPGKLSSKQIRKFLTGFTEGRLKRHLISSPAPLPGQLIMELTSQTFLQVVLDNKADVVVLHTAPWCGFCKGFNHIYQTLAHYFRDIRNITFTRVNGHVNDLPWIYTVTTYPTIVLYPAGHKVNSVPFPAERPKTLPHLVRFILQYASSPVKGQAGVMTCSGSCITHSLATVRQHIYRLRQDIVQTKTRIAQVKRQLKVTASDDWRSSLQLYLSMLRRKVDRKFVQLHNGQEVLRTLQSTTDDKIDLRVLTTLVERYKKQISTLDEREVVSRTEL